MTIQQATERNLLIGWSLITDSQDIEAMLEFVSKDARKIFKDRGCAGLFAREVNGDIPYVYAFSGSVPFIHKELYRLKGAITKQYQ